MKKINTIQELKRFFKSIYQSKSQRRGKHGIKRHSKTNE